MKEIKAALEKLIAEEVTANLKPSCIPQLPGRSLRLLTALVLSNI
jgi:hypothetical protein